MYEFSQFIEDRKIIHSFAHFEHTFNKHILRGNKIEKSDIMQMFNYI